MNLIEQLNHVESTRLRKAEEKLAAARAQYLDGLRRARENDSDVTVTDAERLLGAMNTLGIDRARMHQDLFALSERSRLRAEVQAVDDPTLPARTMEAQEASLNAQRLRGLDRASALAAAAAYQKVESELAALRARRDQLSAHERDNQDLFSRFDSFEHAPELVALV